MKDLFEILSEKKWMINPDFVHGMRKSFEHNLNSHALFTKPEKSCGYVTAEAPDGTTYYPEEYQISEDGSQVKGNWCLSLPDDDERAQDFPFVSVLSIDGPVTRNGGFCSYGSIDHRNMMMRAADHPLCRGHILVINTPGGSAWAKNDYALAIAYAHSKGQRVIALVDGCCASAGMYIASLCDEVYYLNPKDQIGCIGVMACYYTMANGQKDKFTDETYHEVYDPESFDKNKAYRDLANHNDDKELVNELAILGAEFRADMKKAFPNATDVHLRGKMFNAENVKGILVDGQSSFMEAVQRVFALYDGRASLVCRGQMPQMAAASGSLNANANTNINMKNYPLICNACGLQPGEIAVTEEGAFMNASLLDSLEACMKDAEHDVADAVQKATVAESALAEMQGKLDEISAQVNVANEAKVVAENALAQAEAAHSEKIDALNAQHADAIAKKDDEMKALSEAMAKMESDFQEAKDALATAKQSLADMQAQIDELTNEAGEEMNAGNAPQNNGEGAAVKKAQTAFPTWNPADPVASKKAIEEYKRKNGII